MTPRTTPGGRGAGRRTGVAAPRLQAPDLGPEDPRVVADELDRAPRDAFDRIARIDASGGAHLPDLAHAELAEVRISDAYAAAWEGPHVRLEHCELVRLRIGASELPDASWQSVRVDGGRWGYLNLRGAVLEDCLLEDADIEDLDLGAARVTRVAVRGGRIGTLHLHEARCADLDLRGARIERIDGWEGARGVIVDPALVTRWAEDLARHVGLRIED